MGRRPSQPVASDEPLDDIGSTDDLANAGIEELPSDIPEQPPVFEYTLDSIQEAIRNAPRVNPSAFSDNTFDLMPSVHTDAARDAEGNPLTELEMYTRSLRGYIDDDEGDGEGEGEDGGFGHGEDVDDETRNERDYMLSGEDEDGAEAGDEDEEGAGEDEDDGAGELDEDGTPVAKPRKSATDKAIEERLAAQEKAFNDRIAEMQKVLEANIAETQKARAEALAEKQELSLQSERAKQTALAEAEVRAKFPDIEDLDNDAFQELVGARVAKWESGRREELGKQAAEEAAKADAEYRAQQVAIQRQQSYAAYKANLPKGHELMGVDAIEGQGSWADLTAEMHEALSVAGLEVPDFVTFASNFAPMLQSIHQRGFKAGAAKATQKAARSKSAPPPVTSEGGGSQPTSKSGGKPSLTLPKNLTNFRPNFFGDMQHGRRKF